MNASRVPTLLQRLSILLIGLLVTAGLSYGAWVLTPPAYTARALVLLLPSTTAVGPGGNPLLAVSSLEQPASLIVAHYQSESEKVAMKALAPQAEFAVTVDDATRGPVIAVDTTSPSALMTMTALNFLVADIPTVLRDLQVQVDAPEASMVRSTNLTFDQQPTIDWSNTIRMLIAAIVVGLVLTAIAVAIGERSIARRRAEAGETGGRRPDSREKAEPTDSRGARVRTPLLRRPPGQPLP